MASSLPPDERPPAELPADDDALCKQATNVLKRRFGYDAFRMEQEQAVLSLLRGHDTMVIMPTGGGKSMCYMLPALMLPGTAIVISPLLALMQDQLAALTRLGIRAASINSLIKKHVREETLAALYNPGDNPIKLLFTTPESLTNDELTPALTTMYKQGRLSFLAVDEAHCISSWGHDFRPKYRRLGGFRTAYPTLPIIALTATATMQVQHDVRTTLLLRPDTRCLISSFDRPNIHYSVEFVDLMGDDDVQHAAFQRTLHHVRRAIKDSKGHACCIVYTHKRVTAAVFAQFLLTVGLRAAAYHAGLNKATRTDALQRWIAGELDVVAATIAFGMGLDKANVRLVVHLNIPKSIEGLYQESGRAGRDGLPSRSVVLYCEADVKLMQFLARMQAEKHKRKRENKSGNTVADDIEGMVWDARALEQLEHVLRYCQSERCRRRQLLLHFGEEPGAGWTCSGCDYCSNPALVRSRLDELMGVLASRKREWFDRSAFARSAVNPDVADDGSDTDSSDATVDEEAEAAAVAVARSQQGKGTPVLLSRMQEAEEALLQGRPSKLRALVEGGLRVGETASPPGQLKPELLAKGCAQVLKALQGARVGELVGEPYALVAAEAMEATCREGVSSAAGYRSKVTNMVRKLKDVRHVEALPHEAVVALGNMLHELWAEVTCADEPDRAVELLAQLEAAPIVTVDMLARDGLGKAVKGLAKGGEDDEVRAAARRVVDAWRGKLMAI